MILKDAAYHAADLDEHPFKPGDVVEWNGGMSVYWEGHHLTVSDVRDTKDYHLFSAVQCGLKHYNLNAADWILVVKETPVAPPPDTAGNPKTAFGNAKPSISFIPPVAIFAMGKVMQAGADKYGAFNWRKTEVNASVYYNAMQRHLMAWWDGQDNDPNTAASHLAHVMANAALILDGVSLGVLADDRPYTGGLPAYLKTNTAPKPTCETGSVAA